MASEVTASEPPAPTRPKRLAEYYQETNFKGVDLSRHVHLGWGVAGGERGPCAASMTDRAAMSHAPMRTLSLPTCRYCPDHFLHGHEWADSGAQLVDSLQYPHGLMGMVACVGHGLSGLTQVH